MTTATLYILNIFYRAFLIFWEMLPYVIIGILVGELLKYIKIHRFVTGIEDKPYLVVVLISSVLGILSPLCTYGTVPIVMRMNKAGIKVPVLIAFLISSSMMNPQLFFMTWGGLGFRFALGRVIFIIIFSLLTAWILRIIPEQWVLNKKNLAEYNNDKNEKMCNKTNFSIKGYFINVIKTTEYVGFFIVTGVVLAAAIDVLMPASIINMLYSTDKLLSVVLMALISVPFYTCGGGAIPVTKSLVRDGAMGVGNAFAFLNVGSATRVTTIMALASIVRPIFLTLFIGALVVFSVLVGVIV